MNRPEHVPDDSSGTLAPGTGPGAQADRPEDGARPGDAPGAEDLSETVAALTAEELAPAQRRRLLRRLAAEVRARGVGDLFRPRAVIRWVTDAVTDVAPHIPLRDLDTLRRHHDGLDGDALAERLIRNAARGTAAVGAAGGGLTSIEWVITPSLLSAPVLLAAETVAVVAIELKLIGELHAVYHQPLPGNGTQRAVALVQGWASRRGVTPAIPGGGVAAVLGTAARKELRDRLLRRFGRNLTTLGPLLTGAAVASYLNRRATLALATEVRKDLGGRPTGKPEIASG